MTDSDRNARLLPDPDPRSVEFTLISVDDHLIEPADLFEGRLPKEYEDRAPHVVRLPDGSEPWIYENQVLPLLASSAVAGQVNRHHDEPMSFADMRKGAWDVHERVRDMDLNGVWASVNFPSVVSGFCGTIFARSRDARLGFALTQAWNDWLFEEWVGPYPERMVPLGLTWMADPTLGAAEIRRNAQRGFRAVTLPERPHALGYPSMFTNYWDPILQACQETGTVVCLHVGSSGLIGRAPDATPGLDTLLFPLHSYEAAATWIWSGVPLRFPGLQLVMAEGGIGWVPMLLDRLEFAMDHSGGAGRYAWAWGSAELSPAEVLRRNFYFAVLDDATTVERARDVIGIDHIMAEVDYPHADSTWPDSQPHFKHLLQSLSTEEIRKFTHLNAAKLFRHPLPAETKP